MPRFSVIVPAYNASATICETLDALATQTFVDWECVVVDDGSTDDTALIAQGYGVADARFRLVQQLNKGAAGAYRTGVANAKADLLVICAADDFLLPQHLQVMDEFIEANPDYHIYSSNGEYLNHETGERAEAYASREWHCERSLSFEEVVDRCFFSVGAVVRRWVFDVTGGHRQGVYVDDYDLWLRAMALGARHRYTPEVLAVHRVSSFQQSAHVVRLHQSNVEVYRYLLENCQLPASHVRALRKAIARDRALVNEYTVMVSQGEWLRRLVIRVVGESRAPRLLIAVHRISGVTRPLRRRLAGGRS